MKKLDRQILYYLAVSTALTLLLAPLSPAADFTDEELTVFLNERQQVYQIEKAEDKLKFYEDAIARHEGHPLNILIEYYLAQFVGNYVASPSDREVAQLRKLEILDALLSRYRDVDYFTPYADLNNGWAYNPGSVIPRAAVDAASISSYYVRDHAKAREYLEMGLDYIVDTAERRRSQWPSLPPPEEPPRGASDHQRQLFLQRQRHYQEQRSMLEKGEYITKDDRFMVVRLLTNHSLGHPDYRSPGDGQIRISEIADQYAGTPVGDIAQELLNAWSSGTVHYLAQMMQNTGALDDLALTAPLDGASADATPAPPDSPEIYPPGRAPAPDASTTPAPVPNDAPIEGTKCPARPSPRPHLIPALLLALAALLFAASIYTFRRKGPPEKTL